MSSSLRASNRTGPMHLLNLKLLIDFKANLLLIFDEGSMETVLNVAVSIFVITFICYQTMALVPKSSKKDTKNKQLLNKPKKQTGRGCDDDSYFTDLHEHVFNEKEVPYHIPKVHYNVPFMHETEMLRSSQYFYEQMKMRRSVRSFSSKSVPMKIVQNIIKTAGCSPSVGNAQPWKFCVVADEKKKAQIRTLIEADARANYVRRNGEGSEWVMGVSQLQETWKRPYLTDAPLLLIVCHEVTVDSGVPTKVERIARVGFGSVKRIILETGKIAGCLIAISKQIFNAVDDTQLRLFHYNQISTAIAVGMLLSAIQYVGLSTVVTSPLNVGPRICRVLRRPSNECVLVLLPLGYAAADALVPDLKRKPIEHIIKLY